jgi:hypothetical protein
MNRRVYCASGLFGIAGLLKPRDFTELAKDTLARYAGNVLTITSYCIFARVSFLQDPAPQLPDTSPPSDPHL